MPTCTRCGRTQATAEVRRTTKGAVCKDKTACAQRKAHGADATYRRVRNATGNHSALSVDALDAHARQITAVVMEARASGPLAGRDRWAL